VRGIALASVLLTDGAGPVHDVRCQLDLRAMVRTAIRYLDPANEVGGRPQALRWYHATSGRKH
jgi:hypothetical protein